MAVRVMGLNNTVPSISITVAFFSYSSLPVSTPLSFSATVSKRKRTCFEIGIGTGCFRNRVCRSRVSTVRNMQGRLHKLCSERAGTPSPGSAFEIALYSTGASLCQELVNLSRLVFM